MFISPGIDYISIGADSEIIILVRVIYDSVFIYQIGKGECTLYGPIIILNFAIFWYHCLHLVDFGSHISRYMKHLVASLDIRDELGI